MLNFNYIVPTNIFFGKEKIQVLGEEIKKYGTRVLLTYGGGSIKKTGLYDKVVSILKENDIPFWELSGIEPNPRITSVSEGVKICRENNIDFILSVGGGSTIDCGKAIAAAYYYDGDPWDFFIGKAKVTNALPIGAILTIAATGSEMNGNAVTTNLATNQKFGMYSLLLKPKFAILDPTYTYSVSKYQTASGVADIFSHTLESYFGMVKTAYLQDRIAEALLKTCIQYGTTAYNEPDNYEARANLMWAGSLTISGLINMGKSTSWSVHPLQHELSAYYDIAHGVGLAILTPHWMERVLNEETLFKFVEYGVNVWDIDKDKEPMEIAKEAIQKTREFFKSLNIPITLREIGIGDEKLEIMAQAVVKSQGGNVGSFKPLNYEDVIEIYKNSL